MPCMIVIDSPFEFEFSWNVHCPNKACKHHYWVTVVPRQNHITCELDDPDIVAKYDRERKVIDIECKSFEERGKE